MYIICMHYMYMYKHASRIKFASFIAIRHLVVFVVYKFLLLYTFLPNTCPDLRIEATDKYVHVYFKMSARLHYSGNARLRLSFSLYFGICSFS